MKDRQFCKLVLDSGGVEVTIRGGSDHRRFRLPNGETFDVPVGGSHSEVRPFYLSKLKQALRRPPAPRG